MTTPRRRRPPPRPKPGAFVYRDMLEAVRPALAAKLRREADLHGNGTDAADDVLGTLWDNVQNRGKA